MKPAKGARQVRAPHGGWRCCRRCLGIAAAVFLAALLVVYLFRVPLLIAAADYLDVRGTPERSDVAVALGGGRGQRVMEAGRLYRTGMVDRVIVTGGDAYVPGIEEVTMADFMARYIEGVVPDSLILREGRSTSTYEDAVFVLEDLRKTGARSAVIVTDPYHLRRARATFRSVFRDSGIGLSFWAPEEDWFAAEDWWKSEAGLLAVTQEYLKMVFYVYRYGIWPWS
jgi:uncharacterized SAM-binding protein YcdF (DUF218 family)